MKRFLLPLSACLAGGACLCLSALLLTMHLHALREMKDVSLPLAVELPPLEHRLQMLKAQVELSELNAAMRSGSPEEKLAAYVLPSPDDTVRLLAFFDVLREHLARAGMLRKMSAIELGDAQDVPGGGDASKGVLQARHLTLTVTVNDDGRKELLSVLRLSGLLTVADALSKDELQHLFLLTEAQNYAGIVPMEKFLSADLMSYILETQSYEQQLLQSFPSEQFLRDFRSLTQQSLLHEAKDLLGGALGDVLRGQKLWPLQFMTASTIRQETGADGWSTVSVGIDVYSRRRS